MNFFTSKYKKNQRQEGCITMKKRCTKRAFSLFLAVLILISPLQIWASADEGETVDSSAAKLPFEMVEDDSVALGASGAEENDENDKGIAPSDGGTYGISAFIEGGTLQQYDQFEYDDICYQVIDIDDDNGSGTVMVVSNGFWDDDENKYVWKYTGNLIIPATFEYESIHFTVTEIGPSAFLDNTALTDISLPDTIETIGYYAFSGTGVKSIIIPDKVTHLYNETFDGKALQTVTLPAGLEEIEWLAFGSGVLEFRFDADANNDYKTQDGVLYSKDMKKLIKFPSGVSGSFTIPDGVETIAGGAFVNCLKLTSVLLPESLNEIEDDAFINCGNTILLRPGETLPAAKVGDVFLAADGIKYRFIELAEDGAGRNAVAVAYNIAGSRFNSRLPSLYEGDITIPRTVTYNECEYEVVSIGAFSFNNAPNVTSVMIPDTIESIDDYAFNQARISAFAIPESVAAIGEFAFFGTAISEITIPLPVTRIGYLAFGGCPHLTAVYLPDRLPILDGAVFGNSVLDFVSTTGSTENYVINNGAIYDEYMRTLLVFPGGRTGEYTLPDGVAVIGANAFTECELDTLKFPSSLSNIHEYAFFYCDIKELVFRTGDPPNILFPGGELMAFFDRVRHNIAITVYVPNGCKEKYSVAWAGAYDKIIFEESGEAATPSAEFDYEGIRYEVIGTDNLTGKGTVRVMVKISSESSLSSYEGVIEIPETVYDGEQNEYTVTEIKAYAFRNAFKVTEIRMPDTIRRIGEYAFFSSDVTDIVIPDGVTCLEKGILAGCSNLKTVTLPAGLQEIKPFFFDFDNRGVTEFRIREEAENFTVIDGVLFTKDRKTLVLYPSGKTMEEYVVPEGVTTIADGAFSSVKVKRLVLPESLLVIENQAFYYSGIKELVFKTDTPPQLKTASPSFYSFLAGGFGKYIVDIYAPYGALEDYMNQWVNSETGWLLSTTGDGRTGGIVADGKVGFTMGESPGGGGSNPGDGGGGSNFSNDGGGSNPGDGGGGSNPGNTGGNGNTPTDYTPPTTSSGGGADNSNNTQPSPLSAMPDFRSLQGPLSNAIAAASNTGSTVARLRITNISQLSLATLRQLAAQSRKYGETCLINADTVDKGVIITRISFYAHDAVGDLLLTGSVGSPSAEGTKSLFEKYFDNRVSVISLAQQGSFGMSVFIAAKPDLTGMNTQTLYFYSYNKKTNSYNRIQTPRFFFDSNRFLWFSTRFAGEIIITDKPLVLRGSR